MKVILLQELKGKGGEGDVIDVADGFANNYLLTEGLAIKATKGNLKQLEQRKHNIAKREETRLEDAAKMKEALEKATVKVVAQVGDEGQLFGSDVYKRQNWWRSRPRASACASASFPPSSARRPTRTRRFRRPVCRRNDSAPSVRGL